MSASKSWAALVVAICLPLVAGCARDGGSGGTSPPAASASDVSAEAGSDPCAILTAEDLTHATGLELSAQPAEIETTGDAITCVWSSESPAATLELRVSDRPAEYGERRTAIHEAHGDAVDIDVPETDAAFTADSGRIVGLSGGDRYAEITFTYEDDQVADRTRQIAGLAAADL